MSSEAAEIKERVRIREMTIDDLSEVFHLGENLFTSEYSPSMYRTWDEYEITTLFNSDNDLCLVAELEDEHHRFCPRDDGGEAAFRLEIRLSRLAGDQARGSRRAAPARSSFANSSGG